MSPFLPVHLRVGDIDEAAAFYALVLGMQGERTANEEHTFRFMNRTLVCFGPLSDGYYHVQVTSTPSELLVGDVVAVFNAVCKSGTDILMPLQWHPWGEYSFYAIDAWGNSMNIIQADTYTGEDIAVTLN